MEYRPLTERKATLIFFGSIGVLNVKRYVFVGLITQFLRRLTLRTPVTPCSLKISRISLSLQGRSSEQRMTPLEELRDLCNNILTLRSNILVFLAGTLLHQGLSEPEFYGDLVYKFKKM